MWEEPGGTMTMVPLQDGTFLAIQKFFRLFQWEEAEVVWVTPQPDGTFAAKPVFAAPYIHRIDVLHTEKGLFFIGCSLAAHKESREDWSMPGSVFVGKVDMQTREIKEVHVLRDDLYQNHGYWRLREDTALIGCRNGVFRIQAPSGDVDWKIEKIMDRAASDMAAVDLDGDGKLELAAIEPFHGENFRIYKEMNGRYIQVFQHPEITEFYHAVWGGTLAGKPCFVGGCRRGKKQLFVVTMSEKGAFEVKTVDEGIGPSNVHIVHQKERDLLLSANREAAQAAVYVVTADE